MAYINYVADDQVPAELRVPDSDNILRIHNVHPRILRRHYDLYVDLMKRPGPLKRSQREMIAVTVSVLNRCKY